MRNRILVLLLFAVPLSSLHAQTGSSLYPSYDRSTQQSLMELERLIGLGNPKQATELIDKVINGVGYIPPLARIFYKLAQTETDCDRLAQYYTTIITHWSHSAWAQQAVIDYVPILLMSSEQLAQGPEDKIWQHVNSLLSPAADAGDIPEKPEVLQQQVFMQLVLLAHHRREAERVISFQQQASVDMIQDNLDSMKLAVIFARLRVQNQEPVEPAVKQWLQDFPKSELRAFALLTLYQITKENALKEEIKRQIFTTYSHTVEAEILKGFISEGN